MEQTFGDFVRQKRHEKMIKLNAFAKQLGISNVYLSYIERKKRPAPSKAILQKIEAALHLSEDDAALMYSLAALSRSKSEFPSELIEYISRRPYVVETLHIAIENNAGEKEWAAFKRIIEMLHLST